MILYHKSNLVYTVLFFFKSRQYYFFEKLKIMGKKLCKLNSSCDKVSHTCKKNYYKIVIISDYISIAKNHDIDNIDIKTMYHMITWSNFNYFSQQLTSTRKGISIWNFGKLNKCTKVRLYCPKIFQIPNKLCQKRLLCFVNIKSLDNTKFCEK